jgi:predicted transcriptional regulator
MVPVEVVAPETPLDVLAALDPRVSASVAVVDDGVVVGLVQLHDVARLAQAALQKESA